MIRQAHRDDVSDILTVINASNREFYQAIVPAEHFRDPFMSLDQFSASFDEAIFFVYRRDDVILGVVALQIESEASGRISRLYVLPECQRQGIGSALVTHLEQKAIAAGLQRLKLHATEQAHWAVNFYRKLGYDLIEKIEYSQGDVIVMEKTLPAHG